MSARYLNRGKSSGAHRHGGNGAAETASEIKKSIGIRQVPMEPSKEGMVHQIIAKEEPKTNPVPKTVIRTGQAYRHNVKGYLSLQVRMNHLPSIFMNEVIEHIPDSKLADVMGRKVCPEVMMGIFRAINPNSFSMVPPVMHKAREFVYEVLGKYADAISANVWFTDTPSVATVVDAITAKRRISKLFADPKELEALEEKLSADTRCPGWLPIETYENLLKKASNGNGGLTFSKVVSLKVETVNGNNRQTTSLLSMLQSKGFEIFGERKRADEQERYRRMEMSADRIAMRVTNAPTRYQVPHYVKKYAHKTTADAVLFEDGGKVIRRSRIVLFPPLGLMAIETGDGQMVSIVSAGEGIAFVGLSDEEQAFLRPAYRAMVDKAKSEKWIDPVEERREKRRVALASQYAEAPEVSEGLRLEA